MADDITIDATIAFARLNNGNVVAASTACPYFCMEAADEDTARRKVEEAIAFYIEAKQVLRSQQRPATERQITMRCVRPYLRQDIFRARSSTG